MKVPFLLLLVPSLRTQNIAAFFKQRAQWDLVVPQSQFLQELVNFVSLTCKSIGFHNYLVVVSVPGAPRNLSVVLPGPRSVTFTWQPPRITQGLIYNYLIHMVSTSEERNFQIPGTGLSTFYHHNLPVLEHIATVTPFTTYTIAVTANATLYGSGPSTRITVHTAEDG